MNRSYQELLVLQMAAEFEARGSWLGTPYLQSLTYLFEGLVQEGAALHHTWFRGGPYSFDLLDVLSGLRSDECVEWCFLPDSSEPGYRCTTVGRAQVARGSSEINDVREQLANLVTLFLSSPSHCRLRLGRVLYMSQQAPDWAEKLAPAEGVAPAELTALAEQLKVVRECRCRSRVPA